eukprot:6207947-Pleurochrysis_carterae.AAC.8
MLAKAYESSPVCPSPSAQMPCSSFRSSSLSSNLRLSCSYRQLTSSVASVDAKTSGSLQATSTSRMSSRRLRRSHSPTFRLYDRSVSACCESTLDPSTVEAALLVVHRKSTNPSQCCGKSDMTCWLGRRNVCHPRSLAACSAAMYVSGVPSMLVASTPL